MRTWTRLPTAIGIRPTSPELTTRIHGWSGLALGYLSVALPMLAGLVHGRARASTLVLSPVLAIPATGAAAVAVILAHPLVRVLGMDPAGNGPLTVGVTVAAMFGYASGRLLARRPPDSVAHRRGAVVSRASRLDGVLGARRTRERIRAARPYAAIHLAGVPLAAADETKHFKIVGTTGTGKSTAIVGVLSAALVRGDGAVIADPDGAYLARLYAPRRADIVLNPFDSRSLKWDPFAEIESDADVEQLARSLIPGHGDSDRSWSDYARTFFTSVVQQMHSAGATDTCELHRILTRAPAEELKVLLAGTAAEPFLEAGNERMFGSVRSVASSAIRGLKYVIAQRAEPFSIRRWVREGAERQIAGRGSVLFLPYRAGQIAALGSTISAWMRIALFEAMNRSEGDQRLWFVVDELDALGEIDGLKDALARLRKFGGRAVLGFQSIAQVSGLYGRAAAGTLVENCANTLILRCSASEHGGTSQFASRLIGEREVVRTTSSWTRTPGRWLGSITSGEQIGIEPAVMASEIERLADLEGFLKLASRADWMRVKFAPAMQSEDGHRRLDVGSQRRLCPRVREHVGADRVSRTRKSCD